MTRQRIFTLEEARELLPELRTRLTALRDAWKAMAPYREEARRLAQRVDEGGGTMTNAGLYLRSYRDLMRQMKYFEKSGIAVKDISTGLVDFPSIREGRVVFLCWQMEEETITHWHELETGFAARQPLED
ncbi:MAG TPA: DUF2203 domain-containing protein [Nitrospinae bacterium]|nr:DUF2203 domain-containing protein [Nitrospinota bacterium]